MIWCVRSNGHKYLRMKGIFMCSWHAFLYINSKYPLACYGCLQFETCAQLQESLQTTDQN